MLKGFNGTRQVIDLPGSGSPYLAIVATGRTRYILAVESALRQDGATANTAQGFTYQVPNDGTTNGFTQVFLNPADVDFEYGDRWALHNPALATVLGSYDSHTGYATTLFMARSATATPTTIIIDQFFG